jgi:hypothetical protein
MTITIDEIYAAINPLPAKLSAKGKVKPDVILMVNANAKLCLHMNWKKPYSGNDWETESESFFGETFEAAHAKAIEYINKLPSGEQAKLHHFMGNLGKLIDAGKDEGIALDYLNPLLDTMKRLSENVITYMPKPTETFHD